MTDFSAIRRVIKELLPQYMLPAGVKFAFSPYKVLPKAVITYIQDILNNLGTGGYIPTNFNSKILGYNHTPEYMFACNEYLTECPAFDTSKVKSFAYWFWNCRKLEKVPLLNTSLATTMRAMFAMGNQFPWADTNSAIYNVVGTNTALTTLPDFDTSNVANMDYVCLGLAGLEEIPNWDYGKVTSMMGAFASTTNLTHVDGTKLNVPTNCKLDYLFYKSGILNIKDFTFNTTSSANYMFGNCSNLVSIDGFYDLGPGSNTYDFLKCTTLQTAKNLEFHGACSHLFDSCTALESVENLKLAETGTSSTYLFNGCTNLQSVKNIIFEPVEGTFPSYLNMFYNCSKLKSIPVLDVASTSFISFAYNCWALERIEGIDFTKIGTTPSNFYTTTSPNYNLRYMLIKNIGYNNGATTAYTLDLSNANYLNWGTNDTNNPDAEQSLLDTLLTYSYNRVAAGLTTKCTVKLHAKIKAIYNSNSGLFSDDVRSQIIAKGYIIS